MPGGVLILGNVVIQCRQWRIYKGNLPASVVSKQRVSKSFMSWSHLHLTQLSISSPPIHLKHVLILLFFSFSILRSNSWYLWHSGYMVLEVNPKGSQSIFSNLFRAQMFFIVAVLKVFIFWILWHDAHWHEIVLFLSRMFFPSTIHIKHSWQNTMT